MERTRPQGAPGTPSEAASRWAMLYEPDQLVSVQTFDFERTARSTLEVALLIAGAEAGFLATYDKGEELSVLVAQGVDREGVLEEPRVLRLCQQAVEAQEPVVRELPGGPGLPRASGTFYGAALPLRLRLRMPPPGPGDGERERRRFPTQAQVKPLGVLFLCCPPGATPTQERVQALAAFADHAGEVLTNARLYAAATRDALTDLYRRPELEQLLGVEVTLARHTDTPLSLLMVDVDDLSRINREQGRQRGDKVIARVARLVRAQVRDVDACVRYGGEEFAVLLPGTDPEGAVAAGERIRAAVAGYPGFGGGLTVTVSVGAAAFPYHAECACELLRKADQTLFVAKQEGGNRVNLWHKRIPRHALRSDKLMGIITGNQAQDYRNVAMLLDTIVLTNSLLEQKQVLRSLLDMLIQLSACERGVLYLERGSRGELAVEVAQDAQGESIEPEGVCALAVERARRAGLPVAFLGDDQDEAEELVEAARALGLERAICLPLLTKGRQIGCMYFDARRAPGELSESDLIFMQALSRELGNAIEHARLYQENLAQKEEMEGLTQRLSMQVQAQASELATMERSLSTLKLRFNYDKIVGKSEAMQAVFALLDRITDHDVPVLVTGETGTGKELVARSLHFNGPRKAGPFISVNCSAITETLMESELFGHVKGAFTGADRDKQGLFEQAHKGTIFLDEVQDMSPSLQRELLRVLQEGEIRRVGGKDIIKVDVRVISATNRDLRAMVKGETFRQDLFFRLNVVSIELPPLRDRKEDIPLLVQRVLDEVRTPDGRAPKVDPEAMRLMLKYDWPGNVRELRNFLEKTSLLIDGDTIRPEHVRLDGEPASGGGYRGVSKLFELQYEDAKSGFAREYLKSLLARNGGVVTKAAAEAGIVRSSFHKMLRKHGLMAKDFGGAE